MPRPRFVCTARLPLAALVLLVGCDTRVVIDEPDVQPPPDVDLSECPPGAPEQSADLLPLDPGQTWRFKYSQEGNDGARAVSHRGVLTVTLRGFGCEDGLRTQTAREVREGLLKIQNPDDGTWTEIPQRTEALVMIRETAEGVQLPWFSGTLPRYHPEHLSVVRVQPNPAAACGSDMATLTDLGLVRYASVCSSGAEGRSLGMTRLAD